MTPAGSSPVHALGAARRERQVAAHTWLLESAADRQTAATEWIMQGLALLTAGVTWDAVRVPCALLDPDFDRSTEPAVLRRRVEELDVAGPVFCDPYRPHLYFMVPPGTDRDWPQDLAPAGVECLGGTRPYIHHVGIPRPDRIAPPGPYWLTSPNSGARRHVVAHRLYEVLHACAARPEPTGPSTP
ncbi:hypothetical protein ACFVJK_30690 [Streptomyces sp. NPDC127172]|uniref:hypothetical protein n=1 Tax=Streptomyces sp. NPDC127172 TaxID=3345382 RepID=UPI0036345B33